MTDPPHAASQVAEPIRPLNPVTRAAIALYRRPGGYVVLLGAGISKATGIKSAWEILQVLIIQVAAAEGAKPAEPFEWWRERRGAEASYSDVLEQIAHTKEERRSVLAPFFKGDTDGDEFLPSDAHREVARLVSEGFVRIIVTLNFDHLMERALRDEGVEPTVVSGPAAIEAMEPLHSQRCVVIHLHGDYLSPEVLNTPGELGAYAAPAARLMNQIAAEYGLFIVGWSANWDPALVGLLRPTAQPRFTTWWVEPGKLSRTQQELVAALWAEIINLPADEALAQLGVSLDAVVQDANRSRPIDTAVGVASIKRELREGRLAVRTHDVIRHALGELGESEVIRPRNYDNPGSQTAIVQRTESVLAELRPACAFVATVAYWGEERTDRWWLDDIERLAWRPHTNGLTDLINLSRSPAVLLAMTAGTAAVAAMRWDLVLRLLTTVAVEDSVGARRGPLFDMLSPDSCGVAGGSPRISSFVAGILHRLLGLGVGLAIDAWERFEYLAALTVIQGSILPWVPHMRSAGLGASNERALPAVWLDDHLDLIQSFLTAPGFPDGGELTTRRANFDSGYAEFCKSADFATLPAGGGFLASARHYPGRSDDTPTIDP